MLRILLALLCIVVSLPLLFWGLLLLGESGGPSLRDLSAVVISIALLSGSVIALINKLPKASFGLLAAATALSCLLATYNVWQWATFVEIPCSGLGCIGPSSRAFLAIYAILSLAAMIPAGALAAWSFRKVRDQHPTG